MKNWVNIAAAGAFLGLLLAPNPAQGQNKTELALKDVQREVFDLEGKVEAFRTNQSERMAALETLLKQAVDSNKSLSSDLAAMKMALTQSLSEQQRTLADPVSKLKENIGDLASEVTKLREDLAGMDKRSKENSKSIDEILRAIRELPAPAPPPPPPATAPQAASPDAGKAQFQAGLNDYILGRDKAMKEFGDFLTAHPDSPDAPQATLLIGRLYAKAGQSDQAILAFDRVLQQFPGENDFKPAALYEKADQLLSQGSKADALKEYKSFTTLYPNDPNFPLAQEQIKQLQAAAKPAASKSGTTKGKQRIK